MVVKGLTVYRVRGRYYVNYHQRNTYPTYLGIDLASSIPEDPAEFEAWKRARIARFRAEETALLWLVRQDPYHSFDDPGYWGYYERPSRNCPLNDLFMEWIYIIDLDLNVFCVSELTSFLAPDPDVYSKLGRCTQYLRLDNIPRALFAEWPTGPAYVGYPIMSDDVPPEHLAHHLLDIPAPDPELLELYESFSPPPTASFLLSPCSRTSPWHKLQLLLLSLFVEYFLHSFHESCSPLTSSPFVFRQLAYAILCLTSNAGMKFNRTTAGHKLLLGTLGPEFRIPSWEPPDTDTYWLGDVPIVLNPHLSTTSTGDPSPSTKASIAHAAQLAMARPAISIIAVVFSVQAIILVHIAASPTGLCITHTPILPLLTLNETSTAPPDTATPGILALLDLFAARPIVPLYPPLAHPLLPTELCQLVFRSADTATQAALEGSCRLFRALAAEYPRLGPWTLLGSSEGAFVAFDGETMQEKRVVVSEVIVREEDECGAGGEEVAGWEVAGWGREKVLVGVPVVRGTVEGVCAVMSCDGR